MEAKRSRKHEDDGVSLPEDIIFDVLVRLPAKALCRFRCVSKAWRALISDPTFVAAQRSHAGRLIVAMFESWLHPPYGLRVLDMHGNVLRVFEAMQGASVAPTRLDLICVSSTTRLGAMIVDPAAGRADAVTIQNPVHDEMIWWSDFSLGRAASSGTYKVMHLYKTQTMFCDVATITHSGAELTWRQRPPPDLDTSFYSEHKATVKGVLYFLPRSIYERTPRWNRVAAFDLESELWLKTIPGPPLGLVVEQALTELKETLCMVHSKQCADNLGGLSLYANVWRLIDYNKSVWVKAYTIRMPTECLYTKVLDVLDDGRILLLNRIRRRYVLQFFNPSMEAFTDIMEMAEGFSGEMTFYTGSLLST